MADENTEFHLDTEGDNALLDLVDSDDDRDDTEHQLPKDFQLFGTVLDPEDLPKAVKPIPKKPTIVDEIMKKSIIGPDFEKLHSIPMPKTSKRGLRLARKREREKTKGPGWFNIPAQEITEEIKNDLDILRMRSVLDPKRFYKNNDISHIPKYFQVGTVVEAPADYYNSRIPKSMRKKTLVDELLADAEARAHQRKKFKTIVDSKRHAKGRKAYDHSKKLKKKKK